MANKKTHAFTRRAKGGETDIFRKQRIKALKSLTRSLSQEEIEELRKLIQEDGNSIS